MRNLTLPLILCLMLGLVCPQTGSAGAWRDMNAKAEKSGADTPIHLAVASVASVLAYEYAPFKGKWRDVFAFAVPVLIGVAKELTDKNFDIEDVRDYAVAPMAITLVRIKF